MSGPTTVSIIIPTLNEAEDIEDCLGALAAQTWPIRDLQVVVVDAASHDQTVKRSTAAARQLRLDLITRANPARRTSAGLNLGLEACTGEFVVRVDARSRIGPKHVERAVMLLASRSDVGVVGGGQRATARSDRLVDRAIARALCNRYTTGLARYRRADVAGAADTVWMGAFRRADLERLGGWNEAVALNEDWDLNERFRRAGMLVWFDPEMDAQYLPRRSFTPLARQYFRFGRVKGTWWMRGRRPAARQLFLLVLPPVGITVAVVIGAKVGVLPLAAAAIVSAFAIDAVGAREPAAVPVRIGALVATAVSSTSWWIGVVVGAVGELAGVRHAHG